MTLSPFLRALPGLVAAGLLTGCVGYNSTLFTTKSNVGLDFDTKTPTMEVSLARREVVVAPTFEHGQTPPVAASFRAKGAWLAGSVSTTFAGGDAAATLADRGLDNAQAGAQPTRATLLLETEPKPGWPAARLPSPGKVQPIVFGTDSTFGIKAAWSGLTAQYPDSLKVGFNRKEIAFAPVFSARTNLPSGATNYVVRMPSFLAAADSGVAARGPNSTKFSYTQYFATGSAADQLALRPEIRTAMIERLDPNAFHMEQERKQGKSLTDEIGQALDRLDSTDRLGQAGERARSRGILMKKELDELNTLAATDLPGARAKLKDYVQGFAGLSPDNNAQLQAFLDEVRKL